MVTESGSERELESGSGDGGMSEGGGHRLRPTNAHCRYGCL